MGKRRIPQAEIDMSLELRVKGYTVNEVKSVMGVNYNRAQYLCSLADKTLKNVPVYTLQALDATKAKQFAEKLSAMTSTYTAVDMVNSPPHYTKGGIETIDFIEAKGLGYRLGNVVKYITRVDEKGDALENLKKAEWYLKREIAKREGVEG